jgi:hypothetical protein
MIAEEKLIIFYSKTESFMELSEGTIGRRLWPKNN